MDEGLTLKELREARDWEPTYNKRERPQELWDIIMKVKFLPNGNCIVDGVEIDLGDTKEVENETSN